MSCSNSYHDELRFNRAALMRASSFDHWQDQLDAPPLEIRICLRCGSAISDGSVLTRPFVEAIMAEAAYRLGVEVYAPYWTAEAVYLEKAHRAYVAARASGAEEENAKAWALGILRLKLEGRE